MFNKILESESLPASYSRVVLCMLHKRGSVMDPLNYRGIAIVNVITKLFTHIIHVRLQKWVAERGIVPDEQTGFCKEKGVNDNIFTLQTLIQLRLRQSAGGAYALSVDFKRELHLVPQLSLWHKLYSLGISTEIIRISKWLYNTATLQIKTVNGLTNQAEVTEGVLQGEILSQVPYRCEASRAKYSKWIYYSIPYLFLLVSFSQKLKIKSALLASRKDSRAHQLGLHYPYIN